MKADAKPILVIGGGIAGMTAAVEAAEVGYPVILVEKEAYLGGRVMRAHQYFPKMCPPPCGFEINARRIRQSRRIAVHTQATVEEVTGTAGHFLARIKKRPRYVTGEQALDESVAEQLSSERVDAFNMGMGKTKALYLPHPMAYPPLYVLDKDALSDDDAEKLLEICPPGSIDLEMTEEEVEVEVGAVILATGWEPYDATRIDNLGFGQYANIVTNVMMERLADQEGPTGGRILRPSDGKAPNNVAFVQCAGSRDENHLPYCSAVCCMASLKQVRYLREQSAETKATVFYIDIRTIGRLEKYFYEMLDDENLALVKGKVAKISEDPDSHDLILDVEDTLNGQNLHGRFDMVVLAAGIVPNSAGVKFPSELSFDKYGFLGGTTNVEGVFTAGCAKRPCDVSRTTRDATAAALKAIQCVGGRG